MNTAPQTGVFEPHEKVEQLKAINSNLPYITKHLPGIGGILKATPEHFQVEEFLPYEPCGEGEHIFIKLQRQGWNTLDLARSMAKTLNVSIKDVGWAGRKDKHADVIQTFSIRTNISISTSNIKGCLKSLPITILSLRRHRNKLKIGHVSGNRFKVTVSHVDQYMLPRAQNIRSIIYDQGLPNYYGEQRFGFMFGNIEKSVALFRSGLKSNRRKSDFLLSVLQSALFNEWLNSRIESGHYMKILPGDIAKKTDSGGLFTVDDVSKESERFYNREIVYTGPMFGYKMMSADRKAGENEQYLLDKYNIQAGLFKTFKTKGSRRRAIVYMNDIRIEPWQHGLSFEFILPAGSYATVLMREFMKCEGPD